MLLKTAWPRRMSPCGRRGQRSLEPCAAAGRSASSSRDRAFPLHPAPRRRRWQLMRPQGRLDRRLLAACGDGFSAATSARPTLPSADLANGGQQPSAAPAGRAELTTPASCAQLLGVDSSRDLTAARAARRRTRLVPIGRATQEREQRRRPAAEPPGTARARPGAATESSFASTANRPRPSTSLLRRLLGRRKRSRRGDGRRATSVRRRQSRQQRQCAAHVGGSFSRRGRSPPAPLRRCRGGSVVAAVDSASSASIGRIAGEAAPSCSRKLVASPAPQQLGRCEPLSKKSGQRSPHSGCRPAIQYAASLQAVASTKSSCSSDRAGSSCRRPSDRGRSGPTRRTCGFGRLQPLASAASDRRSRSARKMSECSRRGRSAGRSRREQGRRPPASPIRPSASAAAPAIVAPEARKQFDQLRRPPPSRRRADGVQRRLADGLVACRSALRGRPRGRRLVDPRRGQTAFRRASTRHRADRQIRVNGRRPRLAVSLRQLLASRAARTAGRRRRAVSPEPPAARLAQSIFRPRGSSIAGASFRRTR